MNANKGSFESAAWAAFAILITFSPGSALAEQAQTLGEIFNFVQKNNVSALGLLVFGISFVVGLTIVARGLIRLKEAADTAGAQVKYSEGLMPLAAGSFLLALGSTVGIGLASLGASGTWDIGAMDVAGNGTPSSTGAQEVAQNVCSGAGASGSACATVLSSGLYMIASFAINAAGPLSTLVLALCVLIGLVLVGTALVGFSKLGTAQSRDSMGGLMARFVVGIMLTNAHWILDVLTVTAGLGSLSSGTLTNISQQAQSALAYGSAKESIADQCKSVKDLALLALIPFGLISFTRGMLMLKDSAEGKQNATIGQAATHIFGGVALVNATIFIPTVTKMFGMGNVC